MSFIQNNFTMSKSQCKRIFDLAVAISISSSRRIFMAKNGVWTFEHYVGKTFFIINCVCFVFC